MKFKLLIFFIIASLTSFSQEVIVEKIKLIETVDNKYASEIPRVKDLTHKHTTIVDSINAQILDRFMINSFEQNELEEFRWYGVECGSELNGDILYIWFKGEYYGAYPNSVEDDFYFSLKTGEALTLNIIPFQALFSLSGYFDFLNKYWLAGVKKEFISAIECADYEPYCSYYDIYTYTIENGNLTIALSDDCYARVSRACSPFYGISVKLDSIKPYLNNLGKYILLESNYLSKSPIAKFNENIRLKPQIPNNLFIFGRIDDKYPFSMAINIDDDKNIFGYYYYDKKLQKISLEGQSHNESISLVETLDRKTTGFFDLKIGKEYDSKGLFIYDTNGNDKYLTGKWISPDRKTELQIRFTELKNNTKN